MSAAPAPAWPAARAACLLRPAAAHITLCPCWTHSLLLSTPFVLACRSAIIHRKTYVQSVVDGGGPGGPPSRTDSFIGGHPGYQDSYHSTDSRRSGLPVTAMIGGGLGGAGLGGSVHASQGGRSTGAPSLAGLHWGDPSAHRPVGQGGRTGSYGMGLVSRGWEAARQAGRGSVAGTRLSPALPASVPPNLPARLRPHPPHPPSVAAPLRRRTASRRATRRAARWRSSAAPTQWPHLAAPQVGSGAQRGGSAALLRGCLCHLTPPAAPPPCPPLPLQRPRPQQPRTLGPGPARCPCGRGRAA